MDAKILCFEHCDSKIFCCELPDTCPACGGYLSTDGFKSIPFRIPYPFVRAAQHSCAVVMKSTQGKFLDDYHNSNDLHIGLTDGKGTVFEYDSEGLIKHKTNEWNQSVLIYEASEAWVDHWDIALQEICAETRWIADNYSEINNNCYNFVLEFLRRIECDELRRYAGDKDGFCEKYVIPKTNVVKSYITMYRKVKRYGYFIENK